MKKRSRPLTGLTAYFYRKPRPVLKYLSSSEDEEPKSTSNSDKLTNIGCTETSASSVSTSTGEPKSAISSTGEPKFRYPIIKRYDICS